MENPTPTQPTASALSMSDEKTWLMLAHGSALLGIIVPFGNIIGPVIVMVMQKDKMPHVASQAKEALNFNISLTIYFLVSFLLTFLFIGVPLMFALAIFGIVMIVKAVIEANKNKDTHYPATIRLVK